MLQFLKHTMLWLTALSILNTSIDISESRLSFSASTGSLEEEYEEIESIAEFLLDETFDQTLPDQTGNDEQGVLKKSIAFDFSLPERKEKILSDFHHINSQILRGDTDQQDLPAGFTQLFTPPPDKA